MRYDNWSNKNNIELVDLVWMDVQGAESDVLEGIGSELINIRYIWLEYGEIVLRGCHDTRRDYCVYEKKQFRINRGYFRHWYFRRLNVQKLFDLISGINP